MKFGINKTNERLLLDDDEIIDSVVSDSGYVKVVNEEASRTLLTLSIVKIKEEFDSLLSNYEYKNKLERLDLSPIKRLKSKNNLDVSLGFSIGSNYSDSVLVILNINLDAERWNNRFSFLDYKNLFLKLIKPNNLLGFKPSLFTEGLKIHLLKRTDHELELINSYKLTNKKITQSIIKVIEKIQVFDEAIYNKLSKEPSKNYFDIGFNFPEELKIPCEQYLLYFAQFLQDLGISAISTLKEEAGKVLFSVTPTDDVEALDKIREALALYLNLPSSPIIYDDSFASLRLQAEVERLQSSQRIAEMEFRVAQKALGSQDKIIHQQSVLLEQQAKIIERITDKAVMKNSPENKEEFEKIFDGLEVGESKELKEKLGIKFNPATSLKTIGKKIIGGDNDIISLDLDK